MREIASKMERVDQEFQRRDVTIIRLDEKLKDGQNMVQSLAKALRDAEKNILAKNQQLAELQDQLDSQKQSLDAQELREFLHVENQVFDLNMELQKILNSGNLLRNKMGN